MNFEGKNDFYFIRYNTRQMLRIISKCFRDLVGEKKSGKDKMADENISKTFFWLKEGEHANKYEKAKGDIFIWNEL